MEESSGNHRAQKFGEISVAEHGWFHEDDSDRETETERADDTELAKTSKQKSERGARDRAMAAQIRLAEALAEAS